jgi:hypothetical protein
VIAEVTIELEARNLAANCLRSWRIDISRDLLGAWVADVRFGRIGSHGRVVRRVFADRPEAFAFMRKGLRRRATAPRRIAAAYCCARASAELQEVLAELGIDASL